VTSALPAPLAKSAGETLPLQVELAPDERLKVSSGACSRRKSSAPQGDALVVQRAGVSDPVGRCAAAPAGAPGTLVYGSLPALDSTSGCRFRRPDAPWTRARSTCGSASSTSTASG
jgi:uncharacterized protein YhdP